MSRTNRNMRRLLLGLYLNHTPPCRWRSTSCNHQSASRDLPKNSRSTFKTQWHFKIINVPDRLRQDLQAARLALQALTFVVAISLAFAVTAFACARCCCCCWCCCCCRRCCCCCCCGRGRGRRRRWSCSSSSYYYFFLFLFFLLFVLILLLAAGGCWLLVVGCWLLVVGCCFLLPASCLLLAAFWLHWLLVVVVVLVLVRAGECWGLFCLVGLFGPSVCRFRRSFRFSRLARLHVLAR